MVYLSRRVVKIWRVCDSPSGKNSTSYLFWLVQTWSKPFTPVPTCSHLFPPVPTCSHLFTTVPTCSHLFPPVQNCSHLFTGVHTFSHLFTPELLSTLFAQWQLLVEISICKICYFSILGAILLKLHNFSHLIDSYPTVHSLISCIEIIISIPLAAHTTVTMYACQKMSYFCPFEGSQSSVLLRILLKLHILTRLIESFSTLYGL